MRGKGEEEGGVGRKKKEKCRRSERCSECKLQSKKKREKERNKTSHKNEKDGIRGDEGSLT